MQQLKIVSREPIDKGWFCDKTEWEECLDETKRNNSRQ